MTPHPSVAITGMGVFCSVASTVPQFEEALRTGKSGISEGGAFIAEEAWREWFQSEPHFGPKARKIFNNTTASTRWSGCAAVQAILSAGLLDEVARRDVGLIVAGSNLSQNYVAENARRFLRPDAGGRLNPRFAIASLDSNQVGCLSELLALRGIGFTLGAASASGNAALFNACQWIRHGVMERCLVVGAGSNFSPLEVEAFSMLGASATGEAGWERACRPFDKGRGGFVWGQGSGAVLLESVASAEKRGAPIHAEIVGSSLLLDGNHLPDPSLEGECAAMERAIHEAAITANVIQYVNAHGSASPLGDEVEARALERLFGSGPRVNSTKSIVGHCMSAAGVIEAIATVIQLNGEFLHPSLNLEHPISPCLNFARETGEPLQAEYALSNSFGFGGFNSSIVIRRRRI